MRAFVLAAATAVVFVASSARADEGDAPYAIRGTSKGYSATIMIADVSAALVIPTTILPTWSSNPWIWSIPVSAGPLVLTGPLIHAVHERYVAAVASFLGWSSVVATSWFVGAEMSMLFGPRTCFAGNFERQGDTGCVPTPNFSAVGVAIGVAVGIFGTTAMTILDGWMARPFKRTTVVRKLEPSISFERGGATAGLLGSF